MFLHTARYIFFKPQFFFLQQISAHADESPTRNVRARSASRLSRCGVSFRCHGERKKYEKKIGAHTHTHTHHVRNRSFAGDHGPRIGVSLIIKKRGSRKGEAPKKNRKARYPFGHLLGMPIAPSSTLSHLIFSYPYFSSSTTSRPAVGAPPRLASPLVQRASSFFSSDSAKCGVPSS